AFREIQSAAAWAWTLGCPLQVRGQTPAARNNSANLSVCLRRAVPRGFYQVAGRRDACAACSLCLAPFGEFGSTRTFLSSRVREVKELHTLFSSKKDVTCVTADAEILI